MKTDDHISALERLTQLRDSGVLTPEEFDREKARILAGGTGFSSPSRTTLAIHVPFYRKLWFAVLLNCLLITMPLTFLIAVSGPIYKRTADGLMPISNGARKVWAWVLAIWMLAALAKALMDGGLSEAIKQSQIIAPAGQEQSQTATGNQDSQTAKAEPIACNSSEAQELVTDTLESNGHTVKDFGNVQEVFHDTERHMRFCHGDAVLSFGPIIAAYRLYFGPSGREVVEVREGPAQMVFVNEIADSNAIMKGAKQAQAAQQAQQAQPAPNQQPDAAQVATNAPTAPSGTPSALHPKLPQCDSDKLRLMVVRGYIAHFRSTIGDIPDELRRALDSLVQDDSADNLRIRQPIVGRGMARRLEDTVICRSSATDLTNIGGVTFVNPSGDLEGFWFGMSETFSYSE